MASRTTRDNTLAGLFVVGGLALAVWASFMLGEHTGSGKVRTITVRFPMEQGAPGLKAGSPVLLGGQQIGRVKGIAFNPPAPAAPKDVDVQVEVPQAITLYESAAFALDRPLLGNLSSINISGAGEGGKAIADGAVIRGGLAPPAILAQAGISSKEIDNIRHTITNLDQSLTKIAEIIEKRAPDIDAGLIDARAMIADLKAHLGPWSDSITGTLTNVNTASAKIDPIIDDAHAAVTEAKKLITSVQEVIDENRERIANTLKSVESAADKFDKKSMDDLSAAFSKAQDAIASLDKAIKQVSELIAEESPGVRRTLANLRLMSDNLKLTAMEVRSQPWRALHAPTTKELSTQSLYDATRAYAEASSDLRGASEALEAMLASSAARSTDGATIEQVNQALADAMKKYQGAEQRLLDVLIREEKK